MTDAPRQPQDLVASTAEAIAQALAPGAPTHAVARAAQALAELAEQATPDDASAHAGYHALLHALHERHEPRTYAARRWLCQPAYEVEEARILRLRAHDSRFDALEGTAAGLRERLALELERRSGLRHPLSTHLFHGHPSARDVRIHLEHHFFRSRGFHRELTELALALPPSEARSVIANLHEELGEGRAGRAHPELLQRLLQHLEVPCSLEHQPSWPEAHAYLNNRVRCARSGEPAWSLAVMLALEHGTPATHGHIHAMLARMGVPEPLLEFHRIHMLGDAAHAEAFLAVIERLVTTPAARRVLLCSLDHHRALGMRYFDRIWQEIQRPADP
jgi:pyrroloquinoline quinone (PQQ) biosynthesis protein C